MNIIPLCGLWKFALFRNFVLDVTTLSVIRYYKSKYLIEFSEINHLFYVIVLFQNAPNFNEAL